MTKEEAAESIPRTADYKCDGRKASLEAYFGNDKTTIAGERRSGCKYQSGKVGKSQMLSFWVTRRAEWNAFCGPSWL